MVRLGYVLLYPGPCSRHLCLCILRFGAQMGDDIRETGQGVMEKTLLQFPVSQAVKNFQTLNHRNEGRVFWHICCDWCTTLVKPACLTHLLGFLGLSNLSVGHTVFFLVIFGNDTIYNKEGSKIEMMVTI